MPSKQSLVLFVMSSRKCSLVTLGCPYRIYFGAAPETVDKGFLLDFYINCKVGDFWVYFVFVCFCFFKLG